ncbi:hypothetical protein [Acinetobacter bereziniae]|uniref:hypothetical protein n=1 Tax=Acinetobacter bereziniae TaxID=106648 RepID=UPI0018FF3965|nr:hypothetical protein [Acinetobacter bereziniae]MBJ8476472.1 hypothetical protein [Acinetobacter bereziniae]
MGRKKQLNVTGSHITGYDINVKDFNENGIQLQRLYLNIKVDENELYSYEICEDTRFTIKYLEDKISEELDYAIENFNRVEISERAERNYLYFEVHHKEFRQMQVTGKRI